MNKLRRSVLKGVVKSFSYIIENINSLRDTVEELQSEEQDYFDYMPLNFISKAEKAEQAIDSLQSALDSIDSALDSLGEIEGYIGEAIE